MTGSHDVHRGYGRIVSITTAITRAHKRWRIAYYAISSIRFMIFLTKEIVPKINQHNPGKAHLYTTLDIEPSSPDHLEIVAKNIDSEIVAKNTDSTSLTEMVKEKSIIAFRNFGGVAGVATTLKTNLESGIHDNDQEVSQRREMFGANTYHKPPPKGLLFHVMEAFRDTTILILMACAALSLGFGIKEHGGKEGWYEGGSIFAAVFIVIIVSAFSNFRQEGQFNKLSKLSNNINVDVLRHKRRQEISIFDIVVGDVTFLNIGDQVPADGLFIDGHSLQIDESSMTGESDHVEVDSTENPFLLSGSKVVDGYGRMLVTSVGMNTAWGEMMSSISQDSNERTPLQARLDKLTSSIGKVGLTVALLVLLVLLIRYFTGNTKDENGNIEYTSKTNVDQTFNGIVRIVAAAVTIVVVAIPEGLPLAVTLTLAYSMKRMMADHAMVRKLSACETMGSATIICTDKTGTLTLNQMKVTKFWLGEESIEDDSSIVIAPKVLTLFHQGVGLNTTGTIYKPASGSEPEIFGSPTEKAILSWAILELGMDMENLKQDYEVLQVETFNSEKKRSGVAVKKKVDNTVHVHWKGAAEMILAMCSSFCQSNGNTKSLDEDRDTFEKIIQGMAAGSLRCIAFAYRQISEKEIGCHDEKRTSQQLEENNLTLLGIVGLKDPCRPGVNKAVEACKLAGVGIKMITGDNVFTAKAIATECGILDQNHQVNGEVVEGMQFRNYTHEERMEKSLEMARNDAPALKEADIGLSMGLQGTEVAKESSDIVILDDDFASVATVLRWGRCVYNNIQKFIQFQLTVNVAALVINFIAAVSAGEVPLTTVQLLWVNLIMDSLGALALATERPTNELMHKSPVGRTEPLITNIMWRNLLAQSLFQISVLLTFQYKGESIFHVRKESWNWLWEKEGMGMMSSPHGPYELGRTHATMGSKALRGSEFGKNCLGSDLFFATWEHGVGIASNHESTFCDEYVLGSHTTCHT
uniref:Calcium-transporting ATPase n=1 Tax=Fagus sylvatica TaxID=28930 RepID=A0A2N9G7S5_FAGSY